MQLGVEEINGHLLYKIPDAAYSGGRRLAAACRRDGCHRIGARRASGRDVSFRSTPC